MRSSWPHWALPAARQDWCLSSLQTTAQSALDGLKWWRPHNPPKQSEISSCIWLDSLPLKICCSLLSGPQSSLSLIWHYSHAIISYYCIPLPQLLFCRPSNPIFPSEVMVSRSVIIPTTPLWISSNCFSLNCSAQTGHCVPAEIFPALGHLACSV